MKLILGASDWVVYVGDNGLDKPSLSITDFSLSLEYAFSHRYLANGCPYVVDEGIEYDRRFTTLDVSHEMPTYHVPDDERNGSFCYALKSSVFNGYDTTKESSGYFYIDEGEYIFGPDVNYVSYPEIIPFVLIDDSIHAEYSTVKNGRSKKEDTVFSMCPCINLPYLGSSVDISTIKIFNQKTTSFRFVSRFTGIQTGSQTSLSVSRNNQYPLTPAVGNIDFIEAEIQVTLSKSDMAKLMDCYRLLRGEPLPANFVPHDIGYWQPYTGLMDTTGHISDAVTDPALNGIRFSSITDIKMISPDLWSAQVIFITPIISRV